MIFQDRLDAINRAHRLNQERKEAEEKLIKQLNNLGIYSDQDLIDRLFEIIDSNTLTEDIIKDTIKDATSYWKSIANNEGYNYI